MDPEAILFFANADPQWQAAVNNYIDRKEKSKQLQELIVAYSIQNHYHLNRHQLPTIFNILNEQAQLGLMPAKELSFTKFLKLKHKIKNYPKLDKIEVLDKLLEVKQYRQHM